MKTVVYSQRVEVIESYHERRDCSDQRISNFIFECGYLPIPVPNNADICFNILKELSPCGMILTGGNSLVSFGGNAPEKDACDNAMIKYAINHNIPVYGFCRGMQSIADFFGIEVCNITGHVAVRHKISGAFGTICVNSYHNQGIRNFNHENIEVLAYTDDGIIEAIRHKKYPIVGTMWHPEREKPFSKRDIDIVKGLFG